VKISIVAGFFLPMPPAAGGAMEKIWFRFAAEFARRGHEVTVFSRTWPGWPEREERDGVRFIRVPGFAHTRRLAWNLLLDLIWGLRIARRLPAGDLVICNTVSLPAHLAWTRPRAGRVVAVLGRMPKGHGHFYGRVDRLVATSEAVRERISRENPALTARTLVFPNPIDWALHRAAMSQAEAGAPRTIGYVGRLHPEKGLEILLEAAGLLARSAGLPAWRLVLVGPQSVAEGGGGEAYVSRLRDEAARSGAAISILAPIYDPARLASVYGSFDIFCYPSLAEKGEGLSVAPLEAMAAGAAVVTSDLACYRDVIRPGDNGLTFDHGSSRRSQDLADVLADLLRHPERRRRLATQGQSDVQRFDYAVVASALLTDLAALAAGKQAPPAGSAAAGRD
jgi:glycosyltransferase involved in cell wall biosynthesis